jgi:outer membrane protein OmpA-like peptidoglycan-associated protein
MSDFKQNAVKTLCLMALFAMDANAAVGLTEVMLRTDESVSSCTFDRSLAEPSRTRDNVLLGSFSVNCADGAKPYRITTELSPLASLSMVNGSVYYVNLFVAQGEAACLGGEVTDNAQRLHSANRSPKLVGNKNNSVWSYCVLLQPKNGAFAVGDVWPLHGVLDITMADASKAFVLPESASRLHVRFGHNESALTEPMKDLIDTLVVGIGAEKGYQIQLHAHTSLVGTEKHNQDLSLMRLKRVREYLVEKHGVSLSDTWGQAWGESRPMALNTIEDEAMQNRRVDVIFIPKEQAQM